MTLPKSVSEMILKKSQEVNHIDLHDLGLVDNDMLELAELLQKNTLITSIDLHRNNLSGAGMAYLAKCTHLEKINLYQNDIDLEGVKHLFEITSLHYLNLNSNYLNESAAELILTKVSPEFYISVAGNKKIHKDLVKAISDKVGDYYNLRKMKEKDFLELSNNPATLYGNSSAAMKGDVKNIPSQKNETAKNK